MNGNSDHVTKDDLRYEMERLSNDVLSHYATKANLSELKFKFVMVAIWLMVVAASIATSAIVVIERFTG